MALIRDSEQSGADALDDSLPDAATSAYLRNPAFLDDSYFRWGVRVDDLGLDPDARPVRRRTRRAPLLTWWASVVTDAGTTAAARARRWRATPSGRAMPAW